MLFLICCVLFAAAAEKDIREVYFSSDTPYLPEISEKLHLHEYELATDSLNAAYRGELLFFREGDSIRCEIQLKGVDELPFVLDTFMTEPAASGDVRSSLLKFSICLLIFNAISSILFFVRSS